MNTIAMIQARMSSTRLEGKVLKLILRKPMLELQIERIKQAKTIKKIVVVTSNQHEDDAIEILCKKLNIDCYRGSLHNVLDRYYQAAKLYCATDIVRITADCPLIDPNIIDDVVKLHKSSLTDYTSNSYVPCLPDGLDVEVMTMSTLTSVSRNAAKPSEKEHVTSYIHEHKNEFQCLNFRYTPNLSTHRWTVDEPEDFEFVTQVFEHFKHTNNHFYLEDILTLLKDKPELIEINSHFKRNNGLAKSLANDKEQGYE